mmetsp:Transcript_21818/g.34202  ORF Transcript_21818/g.34202 Transcript_21818/m.34202 type:complete len:90 (+) Transcript_21818:416-685(+)
MEMLFGVWWIRPPEGASGESTCSFTPGFRTSHCEPTGFLSEGPPAMENYKSAHTDLPSGGGPLKAWQGREDQEPKGAAGPSESETEGDL